MKKMLFVFNPNTGGGKLKTKIMQILCEFNAAGYRVTVCPTTGPGDACEITKNEASNYDIVVCCGGDGTLNETTNGLMQCHHPPLLGYIPGGTTNDFASSFSLPKADMIAAAKLICSNAEQKLFDVGTFNKKVFNYIAAFGAFSDVSYATSQKTKNALGYFAYVIEGAQRLPNLQTQHIRVQTDDGQIIEDDFIYGMISNSTSVAGISFQSEERKILLDDGLFELVLLRKPNNIIELAKLSDAIFKHDISSPLITAIKVRKLTITSEEEVCWTLDGEFGGACKKVEIEVKEKALKLVAKASE